MSKRGEILETARKLTERDRNQSYGDPKVNLNCYAQMVTAYLNGKFAEGDSGLNAVDGAIFMILAKVSRVAMNQNHPDNYLDMAAYAAIAGECAP